MVPWQNTSKIQHQRSSWLTYSSVSSLLLPSFKSFTVSLLALIHSTLSSPDSTFPSDLLFSQVYPPSSTVLIDSLTSLSSYGYHWRRIQEYSYESCFGRVHLLHAPPLSRCYKFHGLNAFLIPLFCFSLHFILTLFFFFSFFSFPPSLFIGCVFSINKNSLQ